MFKYVLLVVSGAALALLLTPGVRRLARYIGAVDEPDERRVHQGIVPRLGGLAVLGATLGAIGLACATDRFFFDVLPSQDGAWIWLLSGALVVTLAGVLDDIWSLGPIAKLGFQILAGVLVLTGGYGIWAVTNPLTGANIDLGWFSVPLTLLWVVGITNAFNLIDGLDGLAAGVALIASGTLFIVSLAGGHVDVALLSAALIGALAGFLYYNFNPASIFLGDSGSLLLGYLLSVLAIHSAQKGATTVVLLVPILALGLPIMDVGLTVIRRLLGVLRVVQDNAEREEYRFLMADSPSIFQPDQNHIHHRLLRMGLTHRVAVLCLYGVCLILGILAFLAVTTKGAGNALIVAAVAVATYLGIHRLGYPEVSVLRRGTLLPLFDLPVLNRRALHALVDSGFVAFAYGAAFAVVGVGTADPVTRSYVVDSIVPVVATKLIAFFFLGLYQRNYRYTNIEDLLVVLKVLVVAQAAAIGVGTLAYGFPASAGAVFLLDFYLTTTLVVGARISFTVLEMIARSNGESTHRPIFVYGAGKGGTTFLRETYQNPAMGCRVVGFMDDRQDLWGHEVNGVPVLGGVDDLGKLIREQRIKEVVLASSKIPLERIRMAAEVCAGYGIALRRFRITLDQVQTEVSGDSVLTTLEPTRPERREATASNR